MNAPPEKSIKVALVEPDAGEVVRVSELLLAGSVPVAVADAMAAERPEFADADIILIGLHGLGAAERETLTRLHAGFPRIPLVILAGTDPAPWVSEAVRLGAQHVLDKTQLTPEKLSSTIRYYTRYP